MTHLLRLTAVTAAAAFLLVGCGETQSADDGHAGHDHSQHPADTHAEDDGDHASDAGGEDQHEGHDPAAEGPCSWRRLPRRG